MLLNREYTPLSRKAPITGFLLMLLSRQSPLERVKLEVFNAVALRYITIVAVVAVLRLNVIDT
jgi:hypothetical protein